MFNGARDIMEHDWFSPINFEDLYNKSVSTVQFFWILTVFYRYLRRGCPVTPRKTRATFATLPTSLKTISTSTLAPLTRSIRLKSCPKSSKISRIPSPLFYLTQNALLLPLLRSTFHVLDYSNRILKNYITLPTRFDSSINLMKSVLRRLMLVRMRRAI